jgi:predicted ribosome quality control (RQC) complex YloA/Tae2 family protein
VVPDDFVDGAPLTIPLEPALDGATNAHRLHQRARRADRTRVAGAERLRLAVDELEALDRAEARLRTAATHVELGIIAEDVEKRQPARGDSSPRAGARRRPFREYRSAAGVCIWVGRSAVDNHELTFRLARGNDLFLHVRDRPGSHVLVRLDKGSLVDRETLLDAAALAIRFSEARREPAADVDYTLRKNVRPAKGSVGKVYLSGVRTVYVRQDPERLRRLLTA